MQSFLPKLFHVFPHLYERGFSFFSLKRARRATPDTLTILKRTPGMSPLACPLRPKPATRTSSFSSMKLRQPSLGTKAAIFLPFLISCTRTHLRTAELGCLDSIPLHSQQVGVSRLSGSTYTSVQLLLITRPAPSKDALRIFSPHSSNRSLFFAQE